MLEFCSNYAIKADAPPEGSVPSENDKTNDTTNQTVSGTTIPDLQTSTDATNTSDIVLSTPSQTNVPDNSQNQTSSSTTGVATTTEQNTTLPVWSQNGTSSLPATNNDAQKSADTKQELPPAEPAVATDTQATNSSAPQENDTSTSANVHDPDTTIVFDTSTTGSTPAPVPSAQAARPAQAAQAAQPAQPAQVAQPAQPNDGFDPKQPVSSNVQTGNIVQDGDYTRNIGIIDFENEVKFTQQYDKPPRVALSINRLDISSTGSPVNFFHSATNVTRTGFTWKGTVGGKRHWVLDTNWIAIPDNDDYKDVTVTVYDSRTDGGKVTLPNDKTKGQFLRTLDVKALRGQVYDRAPTVVTWLTGFDVKLTNNTIPGNLKIRAEKGDNVSGSSIDIAVNCNTIDSIGGVQVSVLLIPESSKISTFYHNVYDSSVNLPFINPPQTKTGTFFPKPILSAKKIQNTIGMAGLDFIKTGSSIRYQSYMNQSIGSWTATIGTWFDGSPNSITAWVLSSEQ